MKHTTTTSIHHSPLLLLVAVTILALAAASCTHNNGDIGPWFGIWHVDQVTCDTTGGDTVSMGGTDYFMNFQATVIMTRGVRERHNVAEDFGSWQETDGQLIISYSDPDRSVPSLPGVTRGDNYFTIEQRGDKHMVLRLVTADAVGYRYTLRKVV